MISKYIDHMGSDLTVVNSARVSFDLESQVINQKDEKLIAYLAKHKHWTPFSHCFVTIREEVPIFIARQRFKHTVGFSYNEVSRRYVDKPPNLYLPEAWRKRPDKSIKQGSGEDLNTYQQQTLNKEVINYYSLCRKIYTTFLDYGVAPEQARMLLPQSMFTSYYVSGSLSAWARFYSLRAEKTAQKEISVLANKSASIIKPLFPISWEALTGEDNG